VNPFNNVLDSGEVPDITACSKLVLGTVVD